jgi:hypothetical protein
MSCLLCGSGNQAELTAEMVIHFSGLKNLDKRGVWIFPKPLLVCLDCGCSRFTVSVRELASIAKDTREDKLSLFESSTGDALLSGGSASQVGS